MPKRNKVAALIISHSFLQFFTKAGQVGLLKRKRQILKIFLPLSFLWKEAYKEFTDQSWVLDTGNATHGQRE